MNYQTNCLRIQQVLGIVDALAVREAGRMAAQHAREEIPHTDWDLIVQLLFFVMQMRKGRSRV